MLEPRGQARTRECRKCGVAFSVAERRYRNAAYCAECSPNKPGMTPAEKHALWRRENPVKQRAAYLYARAKVRAEKKGLRFDLSLDAVQGALIAGTCPVTGLQFYMGPSAKGGRGQQQAHPLAPSIDRIDSDKGYTDDNVRVVVWAVNAACSSWGLEAYLAIAARALGVSNPSTDAVIARLQENA